ncbi:MAG TPA: C4-type zinc ribbon domain-containing protein [Phnomibacter sp.]|nr:C4-type zinc ribbon domain-containing protein [Phnomibacter sp.]
MATVKDFSVEEKLISLVNLQKIDSKLDEIRVLKGELPMEVADLEDEIAGLHSRRNRIEEEINGINDFIEKKRQGIKDAEQLIAKYEAQSTNVKNSREFEAINKEIEMQQLEVELLKKHIKDANDEIAEKARRLEAANKTIQNKEGILSSKKGELQKIIGETEKEENHYMELGAAARQKVEERLLASYERIRKTYRNGLAVVPVERDACGGCFNAVPPQRQSDIRVHKKIIVCENCGRILVDTELAEKVALQ